MKTYPITEEKIHGINNQGENMEAVAPQQEEQAKANRFDDIRKWARACNLVAGSEPRAQFLKLVEEVGEIAHGLAKGRSHEVKDGIGDTIVVLTILAAQLGMTVEDCIEAAWHEIKDRKGRMVDGVFIKDGD